ncbi:dehydrodolichyl diphosphate synthase complex subunit nus1 [Brachionichthys hirsutus]|uniref:dehydrodolichyl diphosphate synthase complex subunit nus1 n=1 Tax=Brachionichthys hirsutus TaxID=412623 RepID=UPI0036044685
MAPPRGSFWRLLLVLVHISRALLFWVRVQLRSLKGRLWERAMGALLLPAALAGFPGPSASANASASASANASASARRAQWLSDGEALDKRPSHIGLLVAEKELSYTDVANLVVWSTAVGISYVSVYDHHGFFQKNNSRMLEEIVRQQQDLLGVDGSGCNTSHQVLSWRPTVKVLSPEDGKLSIIQAAQQLCRSVENKERTSKDISVSVLDVTLRELKNIPDPELVLKFGAVDSTLGFLPWHIRLTEFISLPTHWNVSYPDLLGVLQQYGACRQRLGQ